MLDFLGFEQKPWGIVSLVSGMVYFLHSSSDVGVARTFQAFYEWHAYITCLPSIFYDKKSSTLPRVPPLSFWLWGYETSLISNSAQKVIQSNVLIGEFGRFLFNKQWLCVCACQNMLFLKVYMMPTTKNNSTCTTCLSCCIRLIPLPVTKIGAEEDQTSGRHGKRTPLCNWYGGPWKSWSFSSPLGPLSWKVV